jgi:hypothetical protein
MSSAALSYSSGQTRRLSTKRRGSTASSASSLAADAAIRDFNDGRRRRSRGEDEQGGESALGRGVDDFASNISATVESLGMPRWTLRALVLAGVGIVLAFAVVKTLPMLTRHEFAGTATLNGRPLAGATLAFHRSGAPATSEPRLVRTATDGSFQIAAHDGLFPGVYAVTVLAGAESTSIPSNYRSSETTPLRFEIREDLAGLLLPVLDGRQIVRKNRR